MLDIDYRAVRFHALLCCALYIVCLCTDTIALLSVPCCMCPCCRVQEFTVKSCIGYCNDVTLRIEPVDGGATK